MVPDGGQLMRTMLLTGEARAMSGFTAGFLPTGSAPMPTRSDAASSVGTSTSPSQGFAPSGKSADKDGSCERNDYFREHKNFFICDVAVTAAFVSTNDT
jgi:hypothetical protein